jgi:hypothetical protein
LSIGIRNPQFAIRNRVSEVREDTAFELHGHANLGSPKLGWQAIPKVVREVPMIAIVQFESDRVAHEHIYWD